MSKLRFIAVFAVLALAIPGRATELILNGGFESGDTSNWLLADSIDSPGLFSVTDGFGSPLNGLPTVGPAGGSYYAVSDQYGPGDHALYQFFTVPTQFAQITLSFDMFVNDWPPAHQTGGSADLFHATDNPLTGTPIKTFYSSDAEVLSGEPNPWVTTVFDLTSLTPGQTYMLRFFESDSQGFLNVGVDNVSLDASGTIPDSGDVPEPSTLALLTGPMIGLMIFLRRWKSGRNR